MACLAIGDHQPDLADTCGVELRRAGDLSTAEGHEIPALKAKTNELYGIVKEVDSAFKQYAERVSEYNEIVARIKGLIVAHGNS